MDGSYCDAFVPSGFSMFGLGNGPTNSLVLGADCPAIPFFYLHTHINKCDFGDMIFFNAFSLDLAYILSWTNGQTWIKDIAYIWKLSHQKNIYLFQKPQLLYCFKCCQLKHLEKMCESPVAF